jgi:hypothetical protein
MKPVLFLRIASVLTLIHAVLHTVGGVFGAMPPTVLATVAVMKANQFPMMGVMRTMWDFHMGLGLIASVALTMEGIIFWQLGTLAKTDASRLRSILTTFSVGYLCIAGISYRYFFAAPVITEILIALCLGLAIIGAKQVGTDRVKGRATA